MKDLIIIGAGPAGLTAAVYARRAGIAAVVFEGGMYGGQVGNTPRIDNYPSYQSVEGWELAQKMYKQAEAAGAEFVYETVTGINTDGAAITVTAGKSEYSAQAVIIANGSKRRRIGCAGEERLSGRGVSWCATCDGQLFKGREAAVVGGGNTAFEDALYLTALCSKVYLMSRTPFAADPELISAVRDKPNAVLMPGFYPAEIRGESSVTGISAADKDGESVLLPVSAVFVALGQTRDNAAFASAVELDKNGYIVAGEDCATSAAGIWAAGDTRTKTLRQIVTAASDGAVAATAAVSYINRIRKSK